MEDASTALYASRVRAVRLTARYNPALQAMPALGQVGVLALGGWLAIKGQITIGTFLAFSAYLAQMVAPVRVLTGLITIGQQARASVIRVFEVIDSQPVITEKPDAVALPAGAPEVELDDVTLRLRAVPAGAARAVAAGAAGRDPRGGRHLRLGQVHDLAAAPPVLRRARRRGADRRARRPRPDPGLAARLDRAGAGGELPVLRHRPRPTSPTAGRTPPSEQVVAAARAAEADEFIAELPDGYDTVVGEQGLTLSGGQRQRVALARALITDPAILVLDDATSAVDARIEAQIHATLRKVMAGRTTLLIAHRRSTLQLADRIAVLDEGRLVDVGTHEELTARCALYRLLLAGPGRRRRGHRRRGARVLLRRGVPPSGGPGRRAGPARRAARTAAGGPRPASRRRCGRSPVTTTAAQRPGGPRGHRWTGRADTGRRSSRSGWSPWSGGQDGRRCRRQDRAGGRAGAPRAPAPRPRPACWPASRPPPSCWPRWRRCRRPATPPRSTRPGPGGRPALHAAPAAAAVRDRAGRRAGPGRPGRAGQHRACRCWSAAASTTAC